MKKYADLTKQLGDIKKFVGSFVLIGAILNIGVVGLGYMMNSDSEPVKYTPFETCFYGVGSLVANSMDEKLLDQSIIEDIEFNKVKFKIDRIHLVKQLTDFSCDVVTKDSKGYRGFSVALDKSINFPHGYKVASIKEIKLTSRYQR